MRCGAAASRTPWAGAGHRDDPLYKIRGLLRHGREHLTATQIARVQAGLVTGDPTDAVAEAWSCYQQLRSAYTANSPAAGRAIAEKVIVSLPSCPIPEVARLGRILRAWRTQLLAYFATAGVSNGGTDQSAHREDPTPIAQGFRNFRNYRLRILLVADATRPYRPRPNHA